MRGRNRKPLPWRRHGIYFIFHVHSLECIIGWLHFWKRWVADGESFFILRFTYECNLIYVSPLFSFADTKRLKVTLQQLAKTKSKTDIEHPPNIGTRFWKIKRYLINMFYRFFIQKIGYQMQNDKKLWQIQITSFTREQGWHMLKNAYNVLLYIRPWT